MPSVIVTWHGWSPDQELCEDLFEHMRELGSLSHSYLLEREPVRIFNEWIEGNVLVAVRDEPSLNGISLHVPFLQPPQTKQARYAGKLSRVHLEGVQFRLFDPRGLYPYDDRISFVFGRTDAGEKSRPLVAVESGSDLKSYEDEMLRSATMVLSEPAIHLRYYFEDWIDGLLGWVRHYYMPDLYYWRHRALPRIDRFEGRDRSDRRAREADWGLILNEFHSEMERWSLKESAQ